MELIDISTLEYRNPIYNGLGSVDVEINHPFFGWIPFTATDDDANGIAILAKIAADETEIAQAIVVEITKDDLKNYATQKRWEKEVGGIILSGMSIATDDRSKMMIMGARIKASENPAFTTKWKTSSGFITLDASTLIAISDAVLAHVDACFALENTIITAIDADEITTYAEIDTEFA